MNELKVRFLKAILADQIVVIESKESKEILLPGVVSFTIRVPVGKPPIYVNFIQGGKSKQNKIQSGETGIFSPGNDFFIYGDPIYLYNDDTSNAEAIIIKNIATDEVIKT